MMPNEFVSHRANQGGGLFESLLMGGIDMFTPLIVEKGGGKITYHVWQCPACKCKVLTANVKTGNGTDVHEVEAISRCRA